ncbi:MAG: hypothetical protein M3004_00085 [Bacteroidota bacterium]|nr:hypothetical protein [Bacteroidota bacterium]
MDGINCNNEKKAFEANDIKYRFLKANGNTSLLKLLNYTDSLYTLNPEYLAKQVAVKEHSLVEQAQHVPRTMDMKKGAKVLKNKATKMIN